MLQSGRVALAAIDDVNLHSTVKELGLDAADFVAVHRVAESLNYLALSPGTPEHVVQAANRAFESMKADGTLLQLYRRWLPGVSPP
jgi:polar amino acid transport system substrate-binding protein